LNFSDYSQINSNQSIEICNQLENLLRFQYQYNDKTKRSGVNPYRTCFETDSMQSVTCTESYDQIYNMDTPNEENQMDRFWKNIYNKNVNVIFQLDRYGLDEFKYDLFSDYTVLENQDGIKVPVLKVQQFISKNNTIEKELEYFDQLDFDRTFHTRKIIKLINLKKQTSRIVRCVYPSIRSPFSDVFQSKEEQKEDFIKLNLFCRYLLRDSQDYSDISRLMVLSNNSRNGTGAFSLMQKFLSLNPIEFKTLPNGKIFFKMTSDYENLNFNPVKAIYSIKHQHDRNFFSGQIDQLIYAFRSLSMNYVKYSKTEITNETIARINIFMERIRAIPLLIKTMRKSLNELMTKQAIINRENENKYFKQMEEKRDFVKRKRSAISKINKKTASLLVSKEPEDTMGTLLKKMRQMDGRPFQTQYQRSRFEADPVTMTEPEFSLNEDLDVSQYPLDMNLIKKVKSYNESQKQRNSTIGGIPRLSELRRNASASRTNNLNEIIPLKSITVERSKIPKTEFNFGNNIKAETRSSVPNQTSNRSFQKRTQGSTSNTSSSRKLIPKTARPFTTNRTSRNIVPNKMTMLSSSSSNISNDNYRRPKQSSSRSMRTMNPPSKNRSKSRVMDDDLEDEQKSYILIDDDSDDEQELSPRSTIIMDDDDSDDENQVTNDPFATYNVFQQPQTQRVMTPTFQYDRITTPQVDPSNYYQGPIPSQSFKK